MISERFRLVRVSENLTQDEFAKTIGATRSIISNIEYGKVEPKDYFIKLVCREFLVNENWLRTGDGEMYQDEGLMKALAKVVNEEDERFTEFVELYFNLNEDFKDIAVDQVKQLLINQKKREPNK